VTAFALGSIPHIGAAVVTLGVFDGVHLGHAHLLEATRLAAADRSAASVVVVFDPHPDEVVRPGTVVPRLLPPDVTLERLRATAIDHVLPIRFDDGVRSLEPEAFLAALRPAIDLRGIVMTPESAFGRARRGTLDRVAEIGAVEGFDAIAALPLEVDGEPVSSSRIRSRLAEGDIAAATSLLGSAPLLRGEVIHGDRRGRELGFPTANLRFDYTPALPALGIYLGSVHVAGRDVPPAHPALVSVGVRPTFHDDGHVLVEVYLLDWDGDLYGAILSVTLESRLRSERRFDSVDALVAQMREDEIEARRRLAADGG
jgi:riboflavin kinase/FMN adenylyltransferase